MESPQTNITIALPEKMVSLIQLEANTKHNGNRSALIREIVERWIKDEIIIED